ncbi:MAG: L,D-transpeptidase family protein [Lachnospiraceae bacterium]
MTIRQTRKRKRRRQRNFTVVGFLLLAIYLSGVIYFASHFQFKTTMNGLNISGKSVQSVEDMITDEVNGYELSLVMIDGTSETIKGSYILLEPEFNNTIKTLRKSQNPFFWPGSIFEWTRFSEKTMVVFDEDALNQELSRLTAMRQANQAAPMDAYISDYLDGGFEIIPEDPGSTIKVQTLQRGVSEAVSNLESSFSLVDSDCYQKPEVTAESNELITLTENMNRYVNASITYSVGDETKILDGTTIQEWLVVDGTSVELNTELVAEYVTELAKEFNTAFRKRTLKTSYGSTVNIVGGDYGWKVDKEGEQAQILLDLENGEKVERDLVYATTAGSRGENDYGDTYVEINLTAQHIFFYKDGNLIVESDFVSGNTTKDYGTPPGAYMITYKERDATLNGEDYSTPVSYWMPFNLNIGLHDATWRTTFGGTIYKTGGSHGCVNLPPAVAAKIYENIEQGDPVLLYTLDGTQKGPTEAQLASEVVNSINAIGEITLESGAYLASVRAQYNSLLPDGRALVTNYDTLVAAEAQFTAMQTAAVPVEAVPAQ